MGTTVQVTDQHGGGVSAFKDELTGMIQITISNAISGYEDVLLMDPNEPKVQDWLKKVFQPIHLEILLRK